MSDEPTTVETDPAEWRFSPHALERARERFGPACTADALRLVVEQAGGWEQLDGDLSRAGSRVTLASADIPGVRFVVGWDLPRNRNNGRHVLVTIMDDPRPRRVRRPGYLGADRRTPGRTTAEELRRRKQEHISEEDV